VGWIGNRQDERLFIDDWAGLGASRRRGAGHDAFSPLAGAGVRRRGVLRQFYLFRAAMENPQLYWLVVWAC